MESNRRGTRASSSILPKVFLAGSTLSANERRSPNVNIFHYVPKEIAGKPAVRKRCFLANNVLGLHVSLNKKINWYGRVRSRITNVLQALSIEFCCLCVQRCQC
jgi:hypothetical protein